MKSIFETIRAINQSGVTILIVEQNARAALKLATRGMCWSLGALSWKTPPPISSPLQTMS